MQVNMYTCTQIYCEVRNLLLLYKIKSVVLKLPTAKESLKRFNPNLKLNTVHDEKATKGFKENNTINYYKIVFSYVIVFWCLVFSSVDESAVAFLSKFRKRFIALKILRITHMIISDEFLCMAQKKKRENIGWGGGGINKKTCYKLDLFSALQRYTISLCS